MHIYIYQIQKCKKQIVYKNKLCKRNLNIVCVEEKQSICFCILYIIEKKSYFVFLCVCILLRIKYYIYIIYSLNLRTHLRCKKIVEKVTNLIQQRISL